MVTVTLNWSCSKCSSLLTVCSQYSLVENFDLENYCMPKLNLFDKEFGLNAQLLLACPGHHMNLIRSDWGGGLLDRVSCLVCSVILMSSRSK